MRSRRSMKLLIGSLVMAFACVCCSTTDLTIEEVASGQHELQIIKLPSDQQELRDSIESPFLENFPTENFDLSGCTKDTYNDFIGKIRNRLKGPDAKFNIPMMRNPATIKDSDRFLLVKLTNFGKETTLAVRVSDLYLVGYCCGKYDQKAKKETSWFFKDTVTQEKNLLFKDTVKRDLGIEGSYTHLGNRDIALGRGRMGTSIENLAKTDGKNTEDVEKAAVVLIQMVCEAARFKYLSDKVAASVATFDSKPYTPDTLMISYENKWRQLSQGVATSDKKGKFKTTVNLKGNDGKITTVGYVSQIEGVLSLLAFIKP